MAQIGYACRNCENGIHDKCIALSKMADFDEPVKLCWCLFKKHTQLSRVRESVKANGSKSD